MEMLKKILLDKINGTKNTLLSLYFSSAKRKDSLTLKRHNLF